MNEFMNKQTNEWTNENNQPINGKMEQRNKCKKWMNEQMNKQTNERMSFTKKSKLVDIT